MTIAFPRAVPAELRAAGLSFYLEPMIEVTPLRSGRQVSANLGPSLWRARYQSPFVNAEKLGVIRAWYDTLQSAESFYGYDVLRQYPLAYAGGWPVFADAPGFDGTCILATVDANNKEIGLSGLPEGFVLSPGDYLAWDYSTDSRALHRVSAGGTADADGLMSIEIRPHVRVGYTAGETTVMLYRAAARMIIVPGSYSDPVGVNGLAQVTFEAIQTL